MGVYRDVAQACERRDEGVPEQRVQSGRGTRGRGEDVSVFGHQTKSILQETVQRVAKLLFLFTTHNNGCAQRKRMSDVHRTEEPADLFQ